MLDKYCCEIKQYCGQDPEKCPIAKRNKDIAELEKANFYENAILASAGL